jgi:hypothetical protein
MPILPHCANRGDRRLLSRLRNSRFDDQKETRSCDLDAPEVFQTDPIQTVTHLQSMIVFFPHNWTLGDASDWLKEHPIFSAYHGTDDLLPWCAGDAECLDDWQWTYEQD